jgi:TatD DNase family protein
VSLELIDSHCHLDDPRLDPDRAGVLARAKAAGITHLVVPAVSAETWPRLRELANSHAEVHAAYGLHPMFLSDHRVAHLEELANWLEREQAVAVGECGLDFYLPGLDRDEQHRYFIGQLALARDLHLPVVVHARRAVDAVIQAIRRFPTLSGEIHSFAGSEQQARQLIDLNFRLGFGGPVTYPRARRLRRLAAELPLEAILIETDAPDQPDVNHRGELNEPAYLPTVLRTLAELRDQSVDEIAVAVNRNARALYTF